MKIIWITNILIGGAHEHVYHTSGNGVWMSGMLELFKGDNKNSITVITIHKLPRLVKLIRENVTYIILPLGYAKTYRNGKRKNIELWKKTIKEINPDIIHIWGSEFRHGLDAVSGYKGPVVCYIQGVLSSIAYYYLAGFTLLDLLRIISFRDLLKNDTIVRQKRKFYIDSYYEKKLIQNTKNIICESDWCTSQFLETNPNVYKLDLNILPIFTANTWKISAIKHERIMCNAMGYPIKGLHILLKAFRLLVDKHPNIRLIIPGSSMLKDGIKQKLRATGYQLYITGLIKKLSLSENIDFVGILSPDEMVSNLLSADFFVMTSAIENHSSSLKEAMAMGLPCITSNVGGISQYTVNNYNCLTYRYEDYHELAYKMIKLYEDLTLREALSKNSLISFRDKYLKIDFHSEILKIYEKVCCAYNVK